MGGPFSFIFHSYVKFLEGTQFQDVASAASQCCQQRDLFHRPILRQTCCRILSIVLSTCFSSYGGFLNLGVPQNHPFLLNFTVIGSSLIFHYKPSVGGAPIYGPPYVCGANMLPPESHTSQPPIRSDLESTSKKLNRVELVNMPTLSNVHIHSTSISAF